MTIQDRRKERSSDQGRRMLSDRRISDNHDYDGIERRSGTERRTIMDRRNLH